jgi:PIN domain nuclease of toxin-antitoxin system
MRILLDTHTLLWALAEPGHLSPRALDAIRDSRNTILASAASAWEIATKHRLGKLAGAEPILSGYVAHLRTLRAEQLPITVEHSLKAGGFEVQHRDPFDRMLAAQSLLEGVPLVTNDRAFQLFGDLETIW